MSPDTKDYFIIAATILAPIVAVQMQKAIENIRDKQNRKKRVFEDLMATRAARVSAEHVKALNMIDLVFYGTPIFTFNWRSKKEANVIQAWQEYLNHLNNRTESEELSAWGSRGDELLTNLLFAIAQDTGYELQRTQLKNGIYSPKAHTDIEAEQFALRRALLDTFAGNKPLNMNVTYFPENEALTEANIQMMNSVSKAVDDKVLELKPEQLKKTRSPRKEPAPPKTEEPTKPAT